MNIPSPYNFVPLSRFVLLPDWAPQVSHDQPFQDGWCGELCFALATHSPLCVGGKQDKATERKPGRVHFYRNPDGHPAIPGSSLKGMLRSVMEIAGFARFQQVEDRRLGVRDISKSKNFYTKAITQRPVKAGWLNFQNGQWRLTPCRFTQIHQGNLIRHFGIGKDEWIKRKTARKRYEILDGLQPLSFDIEPLKNSDAGQATNLGQGQYEGILVVTGQPGADFTKSRAKKREFVFFDPAREPIAVDPGVMADFMFIHAGSDEWGYWKKRLGGLQPGVPVFYHEQEKQPGQAKSLGLAMMYKLAYTHTFHDAIRHTQPAHLEASHADLPELIFGRLDETDPTGAGNLRGRVNISLARCEGHPQLTWTRSTVLSNPKPTFYPAYIRQTPQGGYKTLMDDDAELAGWKRYPVKPHTPGDVLSPPEKAKDNFNVQVKLETLPVGTRFTGKLRFHNLRPMELGALLWCLDFGQRESLRHSLGTGKPYGLGQVSLQLESAELVANDPARDSRDTALILEGCRIAFDQLMQDAWSTVTGQPDQRWDNSEPLRQLLAMADPTEAEGRELRYLSEPKRFMECKNKGHRLEGYVSMTKSVLEPSRNFQPHLMIPPERKFEEYLNLAAQRQNEAETQRLEAEAIQAREAEKNTMSDEQRHLADIEDLLKQAQEAVSSTVETRLARTLNQAHEKAGDWDGLLRWQLVDLARQAQSLGKRKLEKAAKKILRDHGQ